MQFDRTRILLLYLFVIFCACTTPGQQTDESLIKSAFVKSLSNDFDGAIADCTAALKINPNSDNAFTCRGSYRYQKGDMEGAIADYTSAIKLAPKVAGTYNGRADAYAATGQTKLAFADYAKVLELDPTSKYNDILYLKRGRLRFGLKDYEGAILDFTKAIELNPIYIPAFEERAKAYRAVGKNLLADADDKSAEIARQKLLDLLKKPN